MLWAFHEVIDRFVMRNINSQFLQIVNLSNSPNTNQVEPDAAVVGAEGKNFGDKKAAAATLGEADSNDCSCGRRAVFRERGTEEEDPQAAMRAPRVQGCMYSARR